MRVVLPRSEPVKTAGRERAAEFDVPVLDLLALLGVLALAGLTSLVARGAARR